MGDYQAQRTRRFATRSRNGCSTCKKRHIRCDTRRPVCINCGYRDLECHYPPPALQSRGEIHWDRAIPGVQAPWVAIARAFDARIDPFDSLAISLPAKSQKLLSYFARTREDKGAGLPSDNSLVLATREEWACRSVLLIAGVHHMWRTGHGLEYEATYLQHKIESMQKISEVLRDSPAMYDLPYMRTVATLCVAEASRGDLTAAETHLNALIAMIDANWTMRKGKDRYSRFEDEILDRFVLICIHEIIIPTRAKTSRSQRSHTGLQSVYNVPLEKAGGEVFDELEDRLDALCFMPNYIVAATDTATDINVMESLEGLRQTTLVHYSQQYRDSNASASYESISRKWAVAGGEASMLTRLSNTIAPASASAWAEPRAYLAPPLRASWVGMTLSTGFYFHGVLKLWKPIESNMLSWSVAAHQRHLELTQEAIFSGLQNRNFWFWELFVAAYAMEFVFVLAEKEGRTDQAIKGGRAKFVALQKWFHSRIRLWSSVTGVTCWNDAKAVLATMVWPANFPEDEQASSLWENAFTRS